MDLLVKASGNTNLVSGTSFKNLKVGCYPVVRFQFANTKYGPKVIVVTKDFAVFLPPRFSAEVTCKEDVDKMNEDNKATPMMMVYQGKDPEQNNRVDLTFEKIDFEENLI